MIAEKLITSFIKIINQKNFRFPASQPFDFPPNKVNKKYLLYVHIPFCEKLCPYCSFNRYVYEPQQATEYFLALRQELKIYHELGYDCQAVYIGGGTPTILMAELSCTIELIRHLFSISEISVETNPNHLTEQNIAELKNLRINRISVGVQSFDDQILKSIGRYQNYGSGREIKEKLRQVRGEFATVNVDMIFNFPGQTLSMLEADIEAVLGLDLDQVTFYPLMTSGAVDYRREKAYYLEILEKVSPYLPLTTIWCFSKNKQMIDEYIINYDEYIGCGSGSFSFLNGRILANTFSLGKYIEKLGEGKLPLSLASTFSARELMRYDFLMQLFGLRLNLEQLQQKYDGKFYREMWRDILFFKMAGGIEEKNDFLTLTSRGRYYWVIMMREFFQAVNSFRQQCRDSLA